MPSEKSFSDPSSLGMVSAPAIETITLKELSEKNKSEFIKVRIISLPLLAFK